jgi:anti-sigma B factor antagonist
LRASPDPPPFEAHVDRSTGVPVVVVRGELDLATADQLWWCVLEASRDGAPITIDLSATTFMDSTGVTLLLRARGLLDGAGDGMVLRSPSEAVLAVLRIAGVTDLFLLAGDEPGADGGAETARR